MTQALALKPEICVMGDKLAIFVGGSYKLMPLDVARAFLRTYQSELSKLSRQRKRARREQLKATK